MPIFIYWHETDWVLNNWKENFSIAHQTLLEVSSQPNIVHLTVSEACSRAIKKYYPSSKNVHKVHNATNVPVNYKSLLKQVSPFAPFVLNIASIQERKGTDLFVDTGIKVCQRHPTVRFICLGKVTTIGQKLYSNCQSKIKSVGLEDRILFPGHIESPWDFYLRNASVFFLSSRDDPFPLSILEAMCTGRNIVTFNVGGAPEALDKYGVIIDPFDTHSAAEAIINLLGKSPENLVNKDVIERYQNLYTPEKLGDRIANHVNFYLRRT
jgi:glycosyltransferase involved in cell wall biosynthesis